VLTVEILGSDGWKLAGTYQNDRAAKMAELLRLGGAIVRVGNEFLIRTRIGWRWEQPSGSWIGGIDGIDLFSLVDYRGGATLYPEIPGYRQPKVFSGDWGLATGRDAAERILDQFVWRIGVRGLSSGNGPSADTAELPTLSDPEEETQ